MEVVLKAISFSKPHPYLSGFNPCFYGSGSERKFGHGGRKKHGCFNPCFYGSGSESKIKCLDEILYRQVSILVFMEVVLKDVCSSLGTGSLLSFNPCFYGSGSESPCFFPKMSFCNKFQSLFLWKWF